MTVGQTIAAFVAYGIIFVIFAVGLTIWIMAGIGYILDWVREHSWN